MGRWTERPCPLPQRGDPIAGPATSPLAMPSKRSWPRSGRTCWASRIGVHDDFFHLGGQSLLAMRLLARVEDELGVKLSLATVVRSSTIEQMALVVKRRQESPGTAALAHGDEFDDRVVTLQPLGDGPAVFMVPGIGAHVISLRDLALALGNEQPVHGLQPTGHDLYALLYPSLEELASELIKDMKRVARSGPYKLVGFSAGGLIAYEIAQQLRNSGEEVGLCLLDADGPGYPRRLPLHVHLIRHLRHIRLSGPRAWFNHVFDRRHDIFPRLSRLFTSPLQQQVDGHQVPPFATHHIAGHSWWDVGHRYRPAAYASGIHLFAANKPECLGFDYDDPTMGWGSVVEGELKLHQIIGHHMEIIKLPLAKDLAVEIRKCLTTEDAE